MKISFMIIPNKFDIEKSFFEDNMRPRKIVRKKIFSCDLEVALNRKNNVKLKWINTNRKILIDMDE